MARPRRDERDANIWTLILMRRFLPASTRSDHLSPGIRSRAYHLWMVPTFSPISLANSAREGHSSITSRKLSMPSIMDKLSIVSRTNCRVLWGGSVGRLGRYEKIRFSQGVRQKHAATAHQGWIRRCEGVCWFYGDSVRQLRQVRDPHPAAALPDPEVLQARSGASKNALRSGTKKRASTTTLNGGCLVIQFPLWATK